LLSDEEEEGEDDDDIEKFISNVTKKQPQSTNGIIAQQ
jgi:hypothetical protein